MEWKEMESKIILVKVHMGIERWAFVRAYEPGKEKNLELRVCLWNYLNTYLRSFERQFNMYVLRDLDESRR